MMPHCTLSALRSSFVQSVCPDAPRVGSVASLVLQLSLCKQAGWACGCCHLVASQLACAKDRLAGLVAKTKKNKGLLQKLIKAADSILLFADCEVEFVLCEVGKVFDFVQPEACCHARSARAV